MSLVVLHRVQDSELLGKSHQVVKVVEYSLTFRKLAMRSGRLTLCFPMVDSKQLVLGVYDTRTESTFTVWGGTTVLLSAFEPAMAMAVISLEHQVNLSNCDMWSNLTFVLSSTRLLSIPLYLR